MLEHKPGFFLGWLLYRLFKKVNIDENIKGALKEMQQQGTVVYANKYGGMLDYLLYHYTFRSRRLPYPKIAFDLNISLVLPLGKFFRVLFSQVSAQTATRCPKLAVRTRENESPATVVQ